MAFFSQESAANLSYGRTVWEEVHSVGSEANDQERRNLLGAFLFSGDDIYKPVSVLSGGEKSRLTLLKILLLGSNFLILDEPTNHLDLRTKEIFQEALLQYEGTLAIVSHDRYFLDSLVERVVELRDGRAFEYRGDYSYFIEKRRETQMNAPVPVKEGEPEDEAVSAGQKGYKTREMKRLEAEERNRLSRRQTPEERTGIGGGAYRRPGGGEEKSRKGAVPAGHARKTGPDQAPYPGTAKGPPGTGGPLRSVGRHYGADRGGPILTERTCPPAGAAGGPA